MKEVKSSERSTRMGARSFTAIAFEGRWVAVSDISGSVYCGRDNGWENYKITVSDNVPHADFYRSNSGNERVTIHNSDDVIEIASFELADEWLGNHG